jgi:Raf kinase inhibitor-like YbhB/YbcL family protein
VLAALVAGLVAAGCGGDKTVKGPAPGAPARITLTSSAFADGKPIPKRYTCDGDEVSPPLRWRGVSRKAKELALIVEDPDAPDGTFVHWTVYKIPADTTKIDEGSVPSEAVQGRNSSGEDRYGAPCPPEGDSAHRYRFLLYALDAPLDLGEGADAGAVRTSVGTKAIARGELVGTYAR